MVQARRRLLGAQAERGRQPKEGGEHGEDVDDVAGRAPHSIAQDWVERRPETHRQPEVVSGEGEGERDHRVHGPGVQAPVVDGGGDRQAPHGRGVRGVHPERGTQEMIDRLGNAEEHQADADPGREQHGEPRPVGVVRPGVRTAQADAPDGCCHQQQAEEDEDVAGRP